MKRKMSAGQTSVSLPIFVQSTASTTGGGLSGLVHNTAGLVCEYRRQGVATWTAVTLAAGTLGTWASGTIVADGSLAGAYELDLPDAACATGVRWVAVRLYGAANMLPCLIELELDAVNYQDAVRFGLSALPNAASNASGGLYVLNGTGVTVSTIDTSGVNAVWAAASRTLTSYPAFPTVPTAADNATAVRAELATELGRIDATVSSRLAGSSYTAAPTASDNATAVLAATVGVDTLSDLLVDMGAALVGKLSGADGSTQTVKAPGTDTTRLVYTTDTSGNRTAIVRSR